MNKEEKIGFLLIHGFTGTHWEMEPLGEFLRNKGINVDNITLPGHETTPEDHFQTKWTEILDYAQQRLDLLKKQNNKIFIAGLSMGGVITLNLAAKNPDVSGIITMSAPYKIPDWRFSLLKYIPFIFQIMKWRYNDPSDIHDKELRKTHKAYEKYRTKSVLWLEKLTKETRSLIPLIEIPTLILYAKHDLSVSKKHADWIFSAIQSKDKELHEIEKGAHLIPEDLGKEQAFYIIEKWLQRHL